VKICEKYIKSLLILTFFLLFISHSPLFAAYSFSNNCREAMRAILDLKFEDARLHISQEREADPQNGYILYLEHYAEAIELIITEEPSLYGHLIDSLDDRLEKMAALDDGSPDFEWLKAEMLFHAGLAQIKFGTRVSGAAKVFNSYRKIREHRQEHPDFWQNRKLTGMYNIIFDNIPGFMRWAADMFGLAGNSELGMYQLLQYCDSSKGTPGLAEEAVLITGLAYKLIHQEQKGVLFIQAQDRHILENTLVRYLHASTAAYTYQNDLALKLLGEIHQADLQIPFYSLNYLTGRCQLNHLEQDARLYIERYLEDYPGLDYKKDACNRLFYYHLIHGDTGTAGKYRSMIQQVGSDLRDRDQEAILESRSAIVPDVRLLKARLLCDGGYFAEADSILETVDPRDLPEISHRLEYDYRKGRILQLSGHPEEAISFLTKSYHDGSQLPYTFATRAAFSLGKIYEDMQDYPDAVRWYGRCLDVYSSSHTTEGVKDSAEKGMKRAKGKF
jgi:hypothetical protein